MEAIIETFKGQFKFKGKVNEDNYVFKLISKISVGICILCAAIVASTQYIGKCISSLLPRLHGNDLLYFKPLNTVPVNELN